MAKQEKILEKLQSSLNGLSQEEAQERLKKFGPNEIRDKKTNPILKFLSYFWGPIPWMIEVAALLSIKLHHWEDFWIIFILLLMNGVVGFWQEHKADNAIEMLKNKLALKAKVKRDGEWKIIDARELVPGDIIKIRIGEIVPADAVLLECDYLSVDQSALTGESLPVTKKKGDDCYSGSIIKKGEAIAVVTSTGMNTYFGKTAKLVETAKTKSHFQKAVIKIGDYLIVIAIIMIAIIFSVELLRGNNFYDILQFALVLTVAAIPVALPAVLSVSMAVGAVELSKKKAIVSKLSAIEELAGMDVLCSDKTGTLTKNQLTLKEIKCFGRFKERDVLWYGSLASRKEDNDPIDNAILNGLKEKYADDFSQLTKVKIKKFTPFDPVIKRTEAVVAEKKKEIVVTKGAPQVIAQLAGTKKLTEEVNKIVLDFARFGYRTIGVAKKERGKFQLVGLLALYDPPREDSRETVQTAKSMGVDIKMITGDHVAIAKEIAREVGIGDNILEAKDFLQEHERVASEMVEKCNGFAEVFPEHKYRIVQLLQDRNHIVGMTGDGVNDAPALKKANCGIAVSGATDAARSAAAIVLTLPGLSVIIDAIKESRKIFQRMNSYTLYRIAETIRVLLFMTLSILIFNFYPITAIMIVLLALFNDAPIMAIAYDNVKYSNFPEKWNMREVLSISTFLGIIGVFASFGIFYIGKVMFHLGPGVLESFIFLKLAVAGHLTIFVTRTRDHFWSIKPSKLLFWSAVITKLLATLVVVYGWFVSPIGWKLAIFVWIYALIAFVITDYLKIYLYKLVNHEGIKFSK